MKTDRIIRSRMTFLAVVLITALVLGGIPADQVQAEAAPGLFSDAGSAVQADVRPADASVVRSRYLHVDQAMLFDASGQPLNKNSLPEVTLNIFPDVAYTGMITALEVKPWGASWTGNIKGKDGYFYLVVSEGAFIAHIASPEGVYEVSSAGGDDLYQAIQIDQSVLVDHDPAATYDLPGEIIPEGDLGPTADAASSIDIMVVYTKAARIAEGSTAAMKARIALAMTETNTSYAIAGVTTRLNLVHTKEYLYAETGNMETDLNRLVDSLDSYFVGIQTLRNTYGADMVGLIVENGGFYCGLASAIMANATNAYQVTDRSCATGYYSFGHEFGHLQGARHDVYVDPSTSPYAYGHGYVHTGSIYAQRWRTIMAYNTKCSDLGYNCTRLQWWSNPYITFNSAPMGNTKAKNFQVLNVTDYTVANFRQHVAPSQIPVTKKPIGITTDKTPTYQWTKITGATNYQYQLYRGSTKIYTRSVASGACGSSRCSNTPTTSLAYTAYKWRVRAKVGGVWQAFSGFRNFTIQAP
ncbi:MAG: M12 family metallo-peptidase [Chloroflexota bacterium]